jgi:hypothetical protein
MFGLGLCVSSTRHSFPAGRKNKEGIFDHGIAQSVCAANAYPFQQLSQHRQADGPSFWLPMEP